jgi:hypothetical protein
MLAGFTKYDRAVDIVSAFEMYFTASKTELPAQVEHFERFPSIDHPDGKSATPDFSVLFKDGRALAGEIAHLAQHENSADSLCKQISRYDGLTTVPSTTVPVAVTAVDVLVLVPLKVGIDAVRRIHHERLLVGDHPYKPSRPPIVVQFGFDDGRYSFQRIPDPENGQFDDLGRAELARLSIWFEGTVSAQPGRFAEIKASRAFVNDPVDDLYLATHLWAKTFATMAGALSGGFPRRLEIAPSDLAQNLRKDHGSVRSKDVVRALELLERAGLARSIDGTWVVAWDELGGQSKDLPQKLAERACTRSKSGTIAKLLKKERHTEAPARVPTLFDALDN